MCLAPFALAVNRAAIKTDPVIIVRRVVPEDWAAWKAVRFRALTDSPGAFGRTLEEEAVYEDHVWIDRTLASSTGPAAAAFVGADDTADFGGMVAAYSADSAEGSVELVSMWVDPTNRGQGAGQALVHAVTDWAAASGFSTVNLWVVRDNDGARRLYERCGFSATGETAPLPADPSVEEVRMARSLE